MAALFEQYRGWADGVGDSIVNWAAEGQPVSMTRTWPMANFSTALAIAAAYFFCVILGRIVMDGRPAMDKQTYPLRFVYNMLQVMLCSYMCIEAGMVAYRNGYSVMPCAPFDAKTPPVAPVLWLFYASKVLDFADTLFIILGKKWRQLSFLHVYHHITIFLFYWLNLNAGYDGDVYLTVVLNGFVHTVMYNYYFVSMHTSDIWWKKYVTQIQMVQFLAMCSQATYLLCTSCRTFPPRITKVYFGYILSLLVLFAQFYVSSYTKPRKGGKGSSSANGKLAADTNGKAKSH